MNWNGIIGFGVAVLVVLAGILCALVGLVAGMDPEGRGGALMLRLLGGGAALIVAGLVGGVYVLYW